MTDKSHMPDEALRRLDEYERELQRRREQIAASQEEISRWIGAERFGVALPLNSDLLTLAQAARLAGLSLSTLQTQRRRGRLHCSKVGRDWMLSMAEFRRYLEGRRAHRVSDDAARYGQRRSENMTDRPQRTDPTAIMVTRTVYEQLGRIARLHSVAVTGLATVLLKLGLDDQARVEAAVEIIRRYDLGGATDMQQKGW